MSRSIVFYNYNSKVLEVHDVIRCSIYDGGLVEVKFKDGNKERIVESNLPFISVRDAKKDD